MKVMTYSKDNTWETPDKWFEYLNLEFKFTLDPCCVEKTAKVNRFFTPKDDGLSKSWENERVFLNPPYGKDLYKWMEKAFEECVQNHALVVALVPARVDTKWWHQFAMKASDIRFPIGRLKFKGAIYSAPFPVAIVVFRPSIGKERDEHR